MMTPKYKKQRQRAKSGDAKPRETNGAIGRLNHEANPSVLKASMQLLVSRRIVARGEVDLPCIPALLDFYLARLCAMWDSLGKPFTVEESDQLRQGLEQYLRIGYQASPFARLVIAYEAEPTKGVVYGIRAEQPTMQEHYAHWIANREGPLFGNAADAKLVALVAEIAAPMEVKVLDVGAGTGRNAIALAKHGHPTLAIEAVTELADAMRKAAAAAEVSIEIVEADILSPDMLLERHAFGLVVVSEVLTHFRSVREVKCLFEKLAGAVSPGGLVLANAMLARENYQPDAAVREVSQTAWSFVLTREELSFITEGLPFELVSDESMHDYEQAHLAPEHWPPTGWFESWTQGTNVFALPAGTAPIEMRWLLYRKQ